MSPLQHPVNSFSIFGLEHKNNYGQSCQIAQNSDVEKHVPVVGEKNKLVG